MIVANVANSGNDEFYTPDYAIDPIMKYIPEGSRIWCPFDTAESLFVKRFSGGGVFRNRNTYFQRRGFLFDRAAGMRLHYQQSAVQLKGGCAAKAF